jgi:hypothetical protein
MKKYLKNLQFFSKGETAMLIVIKGYTCSCDGGIICHDGGNNACYQAILLHGKPEEGSFHDQNLEDATSKINDILDDVRNKEPNRELAIIAAPDGLFLVWVKEGDEADVLRNILRTEPPPA